MKDVQRITQFMSSYADKVIPRFERSDQPTFNLSPRHQLTFQNIQLFVELPYTVNRLVIRTTPDDYQGGAGFISRSRTPSDYLTGFRPLGGSPYNLAPDCGTAFRPKAKQRGHLGLGIFHKRGQAKILVDNRQSYHPEASGVGIGHDAVGSHQESGFAQTSHCIDIRNCVCHIDGRSLVNSEASQIKVASARGRRASLSSVTD
jgi:hypothetical protein